MIKSITSVFNRPKIILIAILVVGLFLRVYKIRELFMYSHDQDLLGWIIRDILFNRHLRLIGQETSMSGVFIGPLFYYLLIPFYKLTNFDPIGGVLYSTIIGIVSIASIYLVFKKVFGGNTGLISAFIYAVSFIIVFTDREVVPTNSAMLWSIWFFYALYLILQGRQKTGLLMSGLLVGLTWNINLGLAILSPLIILALYLSKTKINLKWVVLGLSVLALTSLPFIVFETRHNFQQTRAVFSSLDNKAYVEGSGRGLAKLDRVFQIVFKNTSAIFLGSFDFVSDKTVFSLLAGIFLFLGLKKIIDPRLFLIMLIWQLIYIVYFTINKLNVAEYYLNGMNVIWIGAFSIWACYLSEKNRHKNLFFIVMSLFAIGNLFKFFTHPENKSGYIERTELVKLIKKDALSHNYQCVSVSYITSPGYDLGYRYLFWLNNIHVNEPKSGSPVYTIVFPLKKVDKVDYSIGALGLVLPEYSRYNNKMVADSCSGENSNLTDPLFGFTQ